MNKPTTLPASSPAGRQWLLLLLGPLLHLAAPAGCGPQRRPAQPL